MSNVNADGIATPDEGNTVDPAVWSAAMADSISGGIGARLAKQESVVGLKASLPEGTTLTPELSLIPFGVSDAWGDFNEGMTFTAGIAAVLTKGIYSVSSKITTNKQDSIVAIQLYLNGTIVAYDEAASTVGGWASASDSISLRCIPGDTIHAEAKVRDGGTSVLPSASYLNIVMSQTSL